MQQMPQEHQADNIHEAQQQQQQQPYAHKAGHCHHFHNQASKAQQHGQRSETTTPTPPQTRRQINKATLPHSHSHSHSHTHGHSHSNQASPFNSRHTSPHSLHSHSYHSSPQQSRTQLQNQQKQAQEPNRARKITPITQIEAYNAQSQQLQPNHAHHHHHHHHRRSRQRRAHSHAHAHIPTQVQPNCSRKHRSVTDIARNSLNTSCRDVMCEERDLRQLLKRKQYCSTSRTELAQYFAEDLYGSSSRRPSSCCTSSDYCYQTDSTSLYGSRSSHESIKSANVQQTQKKHKLRTISYSSIPQRTRSQPTSQNGSLVSIYNEQSARHKKVVLSPSKVTIERHLSKDALSSDLPEYACSPSPIRWSFLGELSDEQETLVAKSGRKASTASEGREREYQRDRSKQSSWKKSVDELPSSSHKKQMRMCKRDNSAEKIHKLSPNDFACNFEESSTTILFHQEAETFNNCCNNFIQCNTYLDQDLQITSEDIHQYLNKGQEQQVSSCTNKQNGKNYPFQPSNALESQYKTNFADQIVTCSCQLNASKEKNLNLCPTVTGAAAVGPITTVATIKTTNCSPVVSSEAHHSGYLPHSYPSYDFTNMCSNNEHLQHASSTTSNSNSDDQHSSLLQSPEPVQVSFESFDAASERKLLSPQTPRSASPCSSNLSVAINPSASGPFLHHHHAHYSYADVENEQHQDYHNHQHQQQQHHHHHHHHHLPHQHKYSNNGESFKLSHAIRNVRKRARKYTEFLRKK